MKNMSHQLVKPPDLYAGAEYLPLATLLLPVVGSSLHGSLADWQRLLLLAFTLHHLIQLMRFPSGLIRASHAPAFPPRSTIPPTANAALLELKVINILAIITLFASPLIALALLRALRSTMPPGDPLIDPFVIRLCLIAVALRPCAYLLNLFRPRRPTDSTRLSTAVQDLELRSQNLTQLLHERARTTATISDLSQLLRETKAPIRDLRRALNNLVRRRQAAAPAALEAHHVLAQTTLDLARRTQTLVDAVDERVEAVARHQASPSAILLARTNKLINATGATLQHIGATLAPPPPGPDSY